MSLAAATACAAWVSAPLRSALYHSYTASEWWSALSSAASFISRRAPSARSQASMASSSWSVR